MKKGLSIVAVLTLLMTVLMAGMAPTMASAEVNLGGTVAQDFSDWPDGTPASDKADVNDGGLTLNVADGVLEVGNITGWSQMRIKNFDVNDWNSAQYLAVTVDMTNAEGVAPKFTIYGTDGAYCEFDETGEYCVIDEDGELYEELTANGNKCDFYSAVSGRKVTLVLPFSSFKSVTDSNLGAVQSIMITLEKWGGDPLSCQIREIRVLDKLPGEEDNTPSEGSGNEQFIEQFSSEVVLDVSGKTDAGAIVKANSEVSFDLANGELVVDISGCNWSELFFESLDNTDWTGAQYLAVTVDMTDAGKLPLGFVINGASGARCDFAKNSEYIVIDENGKQYTLKSTAEDGVCDFYDTVSGRKVTIVLPISGFADAASNLDAIASIQIPLRGWLKDTGTAFKISKIQVLKPRPEESSGSDSQGGSTTTSPEPVDSSGNASSTTTSPETGASAPVMVLALAAVSSVALMVCKKRSRA